MAKFVLEETEHGAWGVFVSGELVYGPASREACASWIEQQEQPERDLSQPNELDAPESDGGLSM